MYDTHYTASILVVSDHTDSAVSLDIYLLLLLFPPISFHMANVNFCKDFRPLDFLLTKYVC